MADHGDEIAVAARFDAQNTESVVRIVEGDAFNQPRQDFAGPGWACCAA